MRDIRAGRTATGTRPRPSALTVQLQAGRGPTEAHRHTATPGTGQEIVLSRGRVRGSRARSRCAPGRAALDSRVSSDVPWTPYA